MDKILIQYEADISKLKAQLDQLEAELKGVDASAQKSSKQMEEGFNKASKSANTLSSSLKTTAGILAGVLAVDRIIDFTKAVVDTTAKFQKFSAVLTNTLGSKSEAQKALQMISDFASKTPFSVAELTESFVKLANQGFKPTQNEMRKLGDLAASTGKSFDQLTEAIIDAQTGEFERLKEFGIRAQKEGDKVKFTFKGVQTQTEFTSEAIRNYVLSLGDAVGVSGSMAANMGDAMDQLQVAIGERFNDAISGALSMVTDLINGFKEFVEIPVSEKLQEEQAELNVLVQTLIGANDNQEVRNKLISEIQSKYPDFLKNLDTEKMSTEDLRNRLQEVNKQYVNKIILNKKQEEFQEQAEEQADALNEVIEAEKELGKRIVEVNKNLNLQQKAGESNIEFARRLNQALISSNQGRATQFLSTAIGELEDAQDSLNKENEKSNSILREKLDLEKRLGITLDDTTESTKAETKANHDNAKSHELSKEELKKKKKELEAYQKMLARPQAGDLNIDPIADLDPQTQRQKLNDVKKRFNEMHKLNKDHLRSLEEEGIASGKRIEEEDIKRHEEKMDRLTMYSDFARNTFQSIVSVIEESQQRQTDIELEKNSERTENEIGNLQRRKEAGLITEQEFEKQKESILAASKKRENAIKTKDAQNDKKLALFRIAIDTASAVIKQIATTPFPAAWPFLAIIGANAALQAGVVASRPIPKFARGKVRIQGPGTQTSDSIPAMLSKDESVINAKATLAHEDDLTAINKGFFEKHIQKKYVLPALKKADQERKEGEKSMARNMHSMVNLMKANEFYDGNIVREIRRNKNFDLNKNTIKSLANEIYYNTRADKYTS
jgi:hypothetical protein